MSDDKEEIKKTNHTTICSPVAHGHTDFFLNTRLVADPLTNGK